MTILNFTLKKNKVSLDIESDYKSIYDYNFSISDDNSVSIYIYLKKHEFGGKVTWARMCYIQLSDIVSFIRKEKLKKIK